jgi:hypothetical protein
MRRTRTNTDTTSQAYLDWQRERQVEIDAEKAAVEAADPVLSFEKASDAEAQAVLQTIRTGYIPDSILPVERLNGRAIANEAAAIANFKYFAESTGSFQYWMASQLLDIAERSQIVPTAPAYLALHNLLLTWGIYEEPVQAAPVVSEPTAKTPKWTRTEQANIDHQSYCEDIIGHDESGKEWTMQLVDALPSKDMLRLLRLFESGTRGASNLRTYMEIQDIKQNQDAERDKVAAQQMGGN